MLLNQSVIFTATQKILFFFCLNPDQEFHEREAARRVQISPAAAHVALQTLTKKNTLLFHRKGRMIFYRLNEARPLIRPAKIAAVVYALEPLVIKLQGITDLVILYGSCATGTYLTDSDVDMFIVTNHEDEAFDAVSNFGQSFAKEVRPIIVSLAEWVDYEEKNPVFFEQVTKGIVLYRSEHYESKL